LWFEIEATHDHFLQNFVSAKCLALLMENAKNLEDDLGVGGLGINVEMWRSEDKATITQRVL